MQVVLIRHAEAVDATPGLRDSHRHLTPLGREQARQLGDRLRWHDCAPAAVYASPSVRAVQTAELVIGQFETDHPISIVPALAPGGEPPSDLVDAIARQEAGACMFVVGHARELAALAALLTNTGDLAGLAKAQAARIVDGVVRWRFDWDAEAPRR